MRHIATSLMGHERKRDPGGQDGSLRYQSRQSDREASLVGSAPRPAFAAAPTRLANVRPMGGARLKLRA